MKDIVIKYEEKHQNYHIVRLGNGTIHRFHSLKDCKKFIADTNRFLSQLLFQLNSTLGELYTHGREIWIVADEMSSHKISERIAMLEHFLRQAHIRSRCKDGNFFTFINLRKFCEHSRELVKFYNHINYIQRDTLRRHKLEALYNNLTAFEYALQSYGQREAYELFSTTHIEMIFEQATQLKIA